MMQTNRRKLKRYVAAPAMLAMLGYVAWFCYSRITYRPEPRIAYWESRLREINPQTPEMMQFDDVVAIFEKGTDRTGLNRARIGGINYDNIVRGLWAPESSSDIVGAIEEFAGTEFQDEYAEFRETVRRGWVEPAASVMANENYNYQFDHRSWATVLLGYSRYLGETRSDVVARSAVWRELVISARQMGQSRYFLAILSCAGNRINISNEITLAVQETDPGTHIPLPNELMVAQDELSAKTSDCVAGIIARQRHIFDSVFVPNGGWIDVAAASEMLYVRQPVPRIWNLSSPVFPDRAEAESIFADFLRDLEGFKCSEDLRSAYDPTLRDFPPENQLLMASWADPLPWRYVESLDWHYAGQTAVEAAACTIALHNYRAEHGKYPDSLQELVPTEMQRLPIDFGNGRPLTYARTDLGYVLYSVGGDGIDDSGGEFQPMIERSIRHWRAVGIDFPCSGFQRAAPR